MAAIPVVEQANVGSDWKQRVIEIILAVPEVSAKRQMSYEEFLAWADEDTLAEWVDGEVIMTSPASMLHQQIVSFLVRLLSIYVEQRGLGIVLSAPFQMKLARSGREPDVLYVAAAHQDRLRRTHLEGPADLVVEVLSPESLGRDRGEKFYEYAQAGVPEYWLIDPEAQWAEFYRLDGPRYRLAFEGSEGEYRSLVLPDFWLRVEWLWQEPRPAMDEVLLAIGGPAYARRQIALIRERGLWPQDDEG